MTTYVWTGIFLQGQSRPIPRVGPSIPVLGPLPTFTRFYLESPNSALQHMWQCRVSTPPIPGGGGSESSPTYITLFDLDPTNSVW